MSLPYTHHDAFLRQTAREITAEYDHDRTSKSNGNSQRRREARPAPTPVSTTQLAVASGRAVTLTKASTIKVRPVRWLWEGRMALGTFVLVGGREGIGKSIACYTLAADITLGRLPGVYFGQPRAVIVAATEDSWSHTVVPRLMAQGADLDLVHRVDVEDTDTAAALSLPKDLPGLEARIVEAKAVLLILDPLMSRLDAALDSHKDQEVRQGLEPLVKVAERTGMTIAGLLHVNKTNTDDPLTALMGSRAFAAVARSVLFVMSDPDNEGTRLLGTPKNNLGRTDLPTLSFTVEGVMVAETDEGEVWTGKLTWTGESDRTIREAMQTAAEVSACNRTVVGEAADWLSDYLASKDGSADSAEIKREGSKAGHSVDALKRARVKLKITSISVGFPRRTHWCVLSGHAVGASSGETPPTTLTTPTAPTERQSVQSVQSAQSVGSPRKAAPTGSDGQPFTFDPSQAFGARG